MTGMTKLAASAALFALTAGHAVAAETKATPPVPKGPSFYVQCDGNPDNMTGAETAVRAIALSAVIGLLAPPPESADASKRNFGADGVAACDQVLTGEKAESNTMRRLGLLLGRAIHQIEAKDYAAAIIDVARARSEAKAAELMDDIYFRRSYALSFDQLEAAALLRQGKYAEAADRGTAGLNDVAYSFPATIKLRSYTDFVREPRASIDGQLDRMSRLYPPYLVVRIRNLFDTARFADAARINEDFIQYDESFAKSKLSSALQAQSALAHALAGNWDKAAARAAAARANDAKRVAEGSSESNRAEMSEMLDLYEVALLAHNGNLAGARRMFTGRSAWLSPPLGAVMTLNAQLRSGAKPDELIGPLAKTADALWTERRDAELATVLASDKDNKTLFELLVPYERGGQFEAQSGRVWKLDRSKILLNGKDDKNPAKDADPHTQIAFLYAVAPAPRYDALLLHTALIARRDGMKQVMFIPFKNNEGSVFVRMGNPGDAHMPASLSMDADAVIAALSPIIPDPETLKARKAVQTAKR